jgi:3'-phosphoadenosine 5'-phosphosulfate sulfotransferase (PAPS reductase)/FAD synthetase
MSTSKRYCISFSGGESSAYMLLHLADIYDLHDTEHFQILFANTGKENEQTLLFVHKVAMYLDLPITWLEYELREPRTKLNNYKLVDFHTASRDGEPFAALIARRNFLPNVVTRYCTQDLKVRPIKHYLRTQCGWDDWEMMIGFRADERQRLANAKANANKERYTVSAPMTQWGVTKEDVNAFWARMPFRLNLKSYQGNCDLCYMKGVNKRVQILRENPEAGVWWAAQEAKVGATFQKEWSLADLQRMAAAPTLFPLSEDLLAEPNRLSCFCSD